MELHEPEITVRRGTFHMRYALPKEKRAMNADGVRLLDVLLVVVPSDDPEYFDTPEAGEFAVVDVVTKEKAWFEMPYGCTPDVVTGMVSRHFATSAYRVGPALWFV